MGCCLSPLHVWVCGYSGLVDPGAIVDAFLVWMALSMDSMLRLGVVHCLVPLSQVLKEGELSIGCFE
jgi:hypothetical protein